MLIFSLFWYLDRLINIVHTKTVKTVKVFGKVGQ